MMNDKIQCECGGKYTKVNKARHYKSKKHLKFEEKNNAHCMVNMETVYQMYMKLSVDDQALFKEKINDVPEPVEPDVPEPVEPVEPVVPKPAQHPLHAMINRINTELGEDAFKYKANFFITNEEFDHQEQIDKKVADLVTEQESELYGDNIYHVCHGKGYKNAECPAWKPYNKFSEHFYSAFVEYFKLEGIQGTRSQLKYLGSKKNQNKVLAYLPYVEPNNQRKWAKQGGITEFRGVLVKHMEKFDKQKKKYMNEAKQILSKHPEYNVLWV